ncbi:hypothetical protein [Mucilaginibacter pedocola]|uniref:Uncharacterized protein n=1 Tax=Mucilaginibacter pedocola TaxID=1792845 RepID=A0A1S9PCN4_9SPHI|nr:hypothetical protein [Mucilaginibacter pedocola]OOQ58715.1 hypothetical protein BC343_08615 [Mucilaginibacter pedocola]
MTTLNYPLSNIQIELMKLYGTNLSDSDLYDLKNLLARFFAERAIVTADAIWDKKGLTDDDMDKLLNAES